MPKIGRNDPCPCKSGKKYKKCCASPTAAPGQSQPPFEVVYGTPLDISPDVLRAFREHQEKEAARTRRYGHVRPPIAIEHQGYKVVAVGNKLTWANNWKTFHDFLFNYVAGVLGKEWGDAEIKKPWEDRHPVAQWYHQLCEFQSAHMTRDAQGIAEATASGPVMAYLWLAYDLYTLEHHALLRERLVQRLKNRDQFQGARYEVSVAAAFVRAGFNVTLEDETDSETSHCEFNATHEQTGAKYSVEAKSRHWEGYLGRPGVPRPPDEITADVYRLLQKALRKRAEHERVIFIDLNVPPDGRALLEIEWFKRVSEQVKRLEDTQAVANPYPPAFIFFTNHPYHYVGNDQPEPGRSTVFTAINNPDFREGAFAASEVAQALAQKYPAIIALYESVTRHVEVPHSFE
jgi:hypothetical protein